MANNYQNLCTTTIVASGTFIVDLDTYNLNQNPFTLFMTQAYANTSSTTGLILTILDGVGVSDPLNQSGGVPVIIGGTSKAKFTSVGDNYQLTPPTANSSNQTTVWDVQVLAWLTSRYIRLIFGNTDPTNPCTLTIEGNVV